MNKRAFAIFALLALVSLLLGGCGSKIPADEVVPPSLAPHSPLPSIEPSPSAAASPSASPSDEPSVSPVLTSVVLQETEDAGQDYIDGITFLGDSTTYGLRYYEMLSGGKKTTQVWTPASGTLTLDRHSFELIVYPEDDEEITILEAVARKKPGMMVITLGVNGVSFMEEDYFKEQYTGLVKGIQETSPDTKIILQSIFPVASNYENLSSINNEKIDAANQWVQAVAEDTGVRYLDTQTVLKGDDGWLPEAYQNGDGLHLNETSFGLVLDYIRTHAYQ